MSDVRHQPLHPFLAQSFFLSLHGKLPTCDAALHTQPVEAEWEARFYQNMDRALDLAQQGMQQEAISQILWDEACREQDSIGVRVHRKVYLCDVCTTRIVTGHAGQSVASAALFTARMTGTGFALVSDRATESAALVGSIARSTQEKDLLARLQRETVIDVRYKP